MLLFNLVNEVANMDVPFLSARRELGRCSFLLAPVEVQRIRPIDRGLIQSGCVAAKSTFKNLVSAACPILVLGARPVVISAARALSTHRLLRIVQVRFLDFEKSVKCLLPHVEVTARIAAKHKLAVYRFDMNQVFQIILVLNFDWLISLLILIPGRHNLVHLQLRKLVFWRFRILECHE